MSILIKGMEMPKEESITIQILPSGAVYLEDKLVYEACAVEIPTLHGRLIDADELANKTFYSKTSAPYITYKKFCDAPTVIERSET